MWGDLCFYLVEELSTVNAGLKETQISFHPVEVGYFDTTPWSQDEAGFDGTWSVYPYFESKPDFGDLDVMIGLDSQRRELPPVREAADIITESGRRLGAVAS